ncbi:hypothetical protein T581_00664, partial [Mycobacterium tuberculosis UT0048]
MRLPLPVKRPQRRVGVPPRALAGPQGVFERRADVASGQE